MSYEEAEQIMHMVNKRWYPELMCSDVCVKFLQIMYIMGIKGRHLKLTRPSTEPLQGHSSAEIKLKGRWRLFDVAFDYCENKSAKKAELRGHPIYKTHYEELIELYNNIEYASFKNIKI